MPLAGRGSPAGCLFNVIVAMLPDTEQLADTLKLPQLI